MGLGVIFLGQEASVLWGAAVWLLLLALPPAQALMRQAGLQHARKTGATVSGNKQEAETETLLEEVTLGRDRQL